MENTIKIPIVADDGPNERVQSVNHPTTSNCIECNQNFCMSLFKYTLYLLAFGLVVVVYKNRNKFKEFWNSNS